MGVPRISTYKYQHPPTAEEPLDCHSASFPPWGILQNPQAGAAQEIEIVLHAKPKKKKGSLTWLRNCFLVLPPFYDLRETPINWSTQQFFPDHLRGKYKHSFSSATDFGIRSKSGDVLLVTVPSVQPSVGNDLNVGGKTETLLALHGVHGA